MHLSKSYKLLLFLNKSHSVPSRIIFVIAVWIISLISTFNIKLANLAAKNIWHDDYKTAMRLVNWLATKGLLNLNISDDPFFDFSAGMNKKELLALNKFIEWRARKNDKFDYLTNKINVIAALAHNSLKQGNVSQYQEQLETYNDFANKALAFLPEIKTNEQLKKEAAENEFSMQDASEALKDFAQFAKLIDLKYYIISGTFLGVVRENGWLAHDYDIDLGVNIEDLDLERVIKALKDDANMILRKEDWLARIVKKNNIPTIERLPTLLKIVHKTGINVDLFIHHLEDKKRWHGSIIHKWDNYDFGLLSYNLDGIEVMGPDDPNRYLTENYGDWKTPIKEFNSTTGTPNLTIVNNLLSISLFIKRLGYYKKYNCKSDFTKLVLQLKKSKLLKNKDRLELDLSRF